LQDEADEIGISKKTIRKILVQDPGMRKSAVKLMPRNLTQRNKGKKSRLQIPTNLKIIF
jgi:hypothetical protein